MYIFGAPDPTALVRSVLPSKLRSPYPTVHDSPFDLALGTVRIKLRFLVRFVTSASVHPFSKLKLNSNTKTAEIAPYPFVMNGMIVLLNQKLLINSYKVL